MRKARCNSTTVPHFVQPLLERRNLGDPGMDLRVKWGRTGCNRCRYLPLEPRLTHVSPCYNAHPPKVGMSLHTWSWCAWEACSKEHPNRNLGAKETQRLSPKGVLQEPCLRPLGGRIWYFPSKRWRKNCLGTEPTRIVDSCATQVLCSIQKAMKLFGDTNGMTEPWPESLRLWRTAKEYFRREVQETGSFVIWNPFLVFFPWMQKVIEEEGRHSTEFQSYRMFFLWMDSVRWEEQFWGGRCSSHCQYTWLIHVGVIFKLQVPGLLEHCRAGNVMQSIPELGAAETS